MEPNRGCLGASGRGATRRARRRCACVSCRRRGRRVSMETASISSRQSACAHNCTRSQSFRLGLPRLYSTGLTPPASSKFTTSAMPKSPSSRLRTGSDRTVCVPLRRPDRPECAARCSTFPSAVKRFSTHSRSMWIKAHLSLAKEQVLVPLRSARAAIRQTSSLPPVYPAFQGNARGQILCVDHGHLIVVEGTGRSSFPGLAVRVAG